ncbi:hypothetical protein P171DRAFT_243904 [Karstenula rhodostoma CBS 690.94]|uniref:Uncharacterized protein n=1 Tax=Karstenula rhodostoma CBS 690.94 TaxID=1392251 RepID=A0A9P4PPT0_9PLEO|nr:hypothetical protein P171DRAFT_243904 [Karstenula rhodostoma CBS 690.94]
MGQVEARTRSGLCHLEVEHATTRLHSISVGLTSRKVALRPARWFRPPFARSLVATIRKAIQYLTRPSTYLLHTSLTAQNHPPRPSLILIRVHPNRTITSAKPLIASSQHVGRKAPFERSTTFQPGKAVVDRRTKVYMRAAALHANSRLHMRSNSRQNKHKRTETEPTTAAIHTPRSTPSLTPAVPAQMLACLPACHALRWMRRHPHLELPSSRLRVHALTLPPGSPISFSSHNLKPARCGLVDGDCEVWLGLALGCGLVLRWCRRSRVKGLGCCVMFVGWLTWWREVVYVGVQVGYRDV